MNNYINLNSDSKILIKYRKGRKKKNEGKVEGKPNYS